MTRLQVDPVCRVQVEASQPKAEQATEILVLLPSARAGLGLAKYASFRVRLSNSSVAFHATWNSSSTTLAVR